MSLLTLIRIFIVLIGILLIYELKNDNSGLVSAYASVAFLGIVEVLLAFYHPVVGIPVLFSMIMALIIGASEMDNKGPITRKKRNYFYLFLFLYLLGKLIQLIEVVIGHHLF